MNASAKRATLPKLRVVQPTDPPQQNADARPINKILKVHKWNPKSRAYKPEYAAELIELLATEGVTLDAACGHFRVTREVLQVWRKNNPEFDDACHVGVAAARLYMERLGTTGALMGKDFNHIAYCHIMWNRFGHMIAPLGNPKGSAPEDTASSESAVTEAEREYLKRRAEEGGART